MQIQNTVQCCRLNPFNPKYLEWYGPCLDLEHTIQVCRRDRIKRLCLLGFRLKLCLNNVGCFSLKFSFCRILPSSSFFSFNNSPETF